MFLELIWKGCQTCSEEWFRSTMSTSVIEKWLWEDAALRVFASVTMIIGVMLTCVLWFPLGSSALWSIPVCGTFALFFIFGYGIIGRKLKALERSLVTNGGTKVTGLIVKGALQTPGVVVLGHQEIVLAPIAGWRTVVPLNEITDVREVKWFNGSQLCGKTGFWLKIPGQDRLGFAVANTVAKEWEKRLNARDLSGNPAGATLVTRDCGTQDAAE